MIEKPEIEDEKIIKTLNNNFLIQASHVEFLPVGNDISSFAYRVETENDEAYFLKIKKQFSNLAGLFVPRFLLDHGIKQVVAPLYTKTQNLIQEMDDFTLILYPFVAGNEAMEVGLSDAQWIEFGSTLKQIHAIELSAGISYHVRRESFVPKWSRIARDLHAQIHSREYADPYQKEFANYWKKQSETILMVIERGETVGGQLQQTNMEFVLCHADIHRANVLVTTGQDMFIVDWDETLLAPIERDLMFVLGEGAAQEELFFRGYGSVEINQHAIAYYRYEWCIQEIGDYGQRVLLMEDMGERTKQDSVEAFMKLFSPIDVVEAALNTPSEFESGKNS